MNTLIDETQRKLTLLTEQHEEWTRAAGTDWDNRLAASTLHIDSMRTEVASVIDTMIMQFEALKVSTVAALSATQDELTLERTEYERQTFTEPIAVLQGQLEAARAPVPVVCSVFHIHDTMMDAEGRVGHRLPWDVVGGVNALLFSRPRVSMTVDEYKNCEDDLSNNQLIALVGPVSDGVEFYISPPRTGTGITFDVSGVQGIKSLHRFFLNGDSLNKDSDSQSLSMTAVRFGSSLRSITEIPNDFCRANRRLQNVQIDDGSLLNVISIGRCFLADSHSLRSVDLRPLCNVTAIERGLLWDCKALENVDLSPFQKVTSISAQFLAGCSSLSALDLSPLRGVRTVCFRGWLNGCHNLRGTIDLTPLRGVTAVDEGVNRFLHVHSPDDGPLEPIRVLVPADNTAVVLAIRKSIRARVRVKSYDGKGKVLRRKILIEEVCVDVETVSDLEL